MMQGKDTLGRQAKAKSSGGWNRCGGNFPKLSPTGWHVSSITKYYLTSIYTNMNMVFNQSNLLK